MTNTSPRSARFRFLRLPATVAASLLILAGCASPMAQDTGSTVPSPTPTSQPADDAASQNSDDAEKSVPDADSATLSMAGQSFTFAPTSCVLTDDEVRILGPGVDDADNSPTYLDIDLGTVDGWFEGKIFVSLNSDKPAPTGTYFEATVGGGHSYSMGDEFDKYAITVEFITDAGVPVGPGTFLIKCD